jgi:conjugative relaxase-like TrwC/TraI family protein
MPLARLIKSSAHAKEYYYEKDPIFAPEGKGANSRYFGELCEKFNLDGQVHKKDFMLLVEGRDPRNGNILIKAGINNGKESEHRPGIDLAFSAPKSVSIVALHLGDERIKEAHDAAVNKALSYVQENLIQYRKTENRKTLTYQSKCMVAACFTHGTSRANDPQLHTHAVIQNVTRCHDGKYRAISNELIIRQQKLVNNIYQNELAIELQKLGYSIDNYGNKFEIRGISEETLNTFSKRSKEINDLYEKLKDKYPNLSEIELRDKAVLESRDNKDVNITFDELKELWETQISRDSIKPVMESKGEIWERDLFDTAIEEVEKTEATYSRMRILSEMFNLSKGEYSLSEMETMIDKKISESAIREVGTHRYYNVEEQHFATLKTIITENRIVEIVDSTADSRAAIFERKEFDHMLTKEYETAENKKQLTAGQRAFVEGTLTSKDFVGFVQGDAGTGKTAAVERIREILEANKSDVELVGLGFTGIAADELNKAAAIGTSTIASFLMSKKSKEMSNKLILVDEASMVDSKDFLNIMELALSGKNNRVFFVGDAKQFQAIGAGKMFKELQESGLTKGQIQVIMMNEILRQKTPELQELVKLVKDYKEERDANGIKDALPILQKAFSLMESADYIRELKSESKDGEITRSMIQDKAIEEFFNSDDALMFTASREERDELNRIVHGRKFSVAELAESKKITIRENNGEPRLAANYKVNDVVILNNSGRRKEYRVREVLGNENKLVLEYRAKKIVKDLSKVSVSGSKIASSFRQGDTASIYDHSSKQYRDYIVKEVLAKENKLILDYKDNKPREITINLSKEKVHRSYREKIREIVIGEAVMFTNNDSYVGKDDGLERGVMNGMKGTVERLDDNWNIEVKLRDGKVVHFNLKNYNYLEHAYAVTTIKTQGATCKKAIMVHTADDNVKTENFYTAATRASHELRIFTPDKARLMSAVSKEQEKTSTMEFKGRIEEIVREEKQKSKQPSQKIKTQHSISSP